MDIQGITPVLPVDDVAKAAEIWSAMLGLKATFIDGDRWAQFDVGGKRIALSGTDRVSDQAGLMIKVANLPAARAAATAAGLAATEPQEGPHEVRCVVTAPGGWPIILYATRP